MGISISVIVPVYNTEKYIRECINSIVKQTFTELEIIIVDDGSTDSSITICRELALADHRIKIYSKSNGGLSDARNYGIEKANCEYICFLDSDDYIDSNYFEILFRNIREKHADISVAGIKHIHNNNVYQIRKIDGGSILTREAALRELFISRRISNSVCNKLFKKRLFDSIRFPKGRLYEDEFVTYRLFAQSDRVVISDKIFYYYRFNNSSITHRPFNRQELDRVFASIEKIEFCKKNYPKLKKYTEQYLVYDCISILSKMDIYDVKYDKYIVKNIRKYLLIYLFGGNSLCSKVCAAVAAISPDVTIHIIKQVKKYINRV